MGAVKTTMNMQQMFKLGEYLKGLEPKYVQASTFVQLADDATKALGFPVSTSNVRSVAAGLGIEKRRGGPKSAAAGVSEEDFRVLVHAVDRVYDYLGRKPLPEFNSLVGRYK